MSGLRTKDGVPVVSDFAAPEPPLVEDYETGDVYSINENQQVIPLSAFTYDIRRFGTVGASAGNSQQTVFALAIAAANGRPVYIPKDTYYWDDSLLISDGTSVVLHAEPGTVIKKTAVKKGIRIEPTAVYSSTVASDQTVRTEVVVAGAAFTTNQYVDYWVQVSTTFNAKVRLQRHLVVSNTSDTLTLRFGTGVQALTGDAVAIYPATARVEIENIEIDGQDFTGAGLVVLFTDSVTLKNFDSHSHGQDPTAESNCATINSCRRVRVKNGHTYDGLLGMIVYNCDDAIVDAHTSTNAFFQATMQMKDCRNSRFINCHTYGGPDNNSTCGYDLRASGLHPAYDCKIINCHSEDLDQQGALAHSLITEGDAYGIPQGFAIERLHTVSCQNGPMLAIQEPAAGVTDFGMIDSYISDCTTEDSTANGARAQGFAGQTATNIEIRNDRSSRCVDRSVFLENWDDVRIIDSVSENPGYGSAGNEPHHKISDCLRTVIENPQYIINDALVNSSTCVLETGTADYTSVSNPTIIDDQSEITTDFTFLGANSRAFGIKAKGANTVSTVVADYAVLGTSSSGVYTPTLTNVANLDGSAAFECQYSRVGSVVSVSGKVTADPTAPATLTQLGISLPIASNIGASEDCAGVAFASGIAGQGAAILGDAANNRAEMDWVSGDVSSQAMYFNFQYSVI